MNRRSFLATLFAAPVAATIALKAPPEAVQIDTSHFTQFLRTPFSFTARHNKFLLASPRWIRMVRQWADEDGRGGLRGRRARWKS